MRVGFYHVGESVQHLRLASRLVESVRAVMPSAGVIAFTDPATELAVVTMLEVDARMVLPGGPMALRCLEAFASAEGDWLFVDTDVELRSDVRQVFDDSDFDIAVATRQGTLLDKEVGTKFMARMPFNKGAVFSRCQAFWMAAADHLRTLKPELQAWMGDQVAVNHVIASGHFKVKVLSNAYNYPPKHRDEDVRGKHILHFKGPRKEWALEGCFA